MKNTVYVLDYQYYQYNTGSADNGNYKKSVTFDSIKEALSLANKINQSIEKNNASDKQYKEQDYSLDLESILSQDDDQDLKDQLLSNPGYFIEFSLTKSERKDTKLNLDGQEVDDCGTLLSQYDDISFYDCPYCYDVDNGAHDDCIHCSGSGNRKLTHQSITLAQSANEWLKDQMNSFWSDYNEVYNLKRYMIDWYIQYPNSLCIEAGYSCRGSETADNYEMPLSWLYAENRKQLIKLQYDKEVQEKQLQDKKDKLNEIEYLKQKAKDLENQLKNQEN